MVLKTIWFLRFFGKIAWAERNLGLDGGTSLFYKLLGVLFILISLMFMTGILGKIFGKIYTF